jgi:hypothetical protein
MMLAMRLNQPRSLRIRSAICPVRGNTVCRLYRPQALPL